MHKMKQKRFIVIPLGFLFISFSVFSQKKVNWNTEAKKIKLLEPDKTLPKRVRDSVKREGCSIPQSSFHKKPHNIVQGHFSSSTKKDWALLCSKNGKSSIFVIWEKGQPCPSHLAQEADKNYLQKIADNTIGYSRLLSAASKKFILTHQKNYGGPLPKKLDHQGIDDAFAEKGSVIYYCEEGQWLSLQGAD